jgi:hypothetical protein
MPSDPPTICQERVRLLREYSDAAANYAGSVRQMADLAIAGRETESNAARRRCRAAFCDREGESRSVEDVDSL